MKRNNTQKSAARRIQATTGATHPQALRFAAYDSTKIMLGTDDIGRPVHLTVGQETVPTSLPVLVQGEARSGKTRLVRGIGAALVAAGWRNIVDIRVREFGQLMGVRHIDTHDAAAYLDTMMAERRALELAGVNLAIPRGWMVAEPVMLLVDDGEAGIGLIEDRVGRFQALGIQAIVAGRSVGTRTLRGLHVATLDLSAEKNRFRALMTERHESGRCRYTARSWEELLGPPDVSRCTRKQAKPAESVAERRKSRRARAR